jgi:hypothetical protein
MKIWCSKGEDLLALKKVEILSPVRKNFYGLLLGIGCGIAAVGTPYFDYRDLHLLEIATNDQIRYSAELQTISHLEELFQSRIRPAP